jgi:hypothetical protein
VKPVLSFLSLVVFSRVFALGSGGGLVQEPEVKAPGWVFGTSGPLVPDGQSVRGYHLGVDPYERHGESASVTVYSDSSEAQGWRSGMQAIQAEALRGKRIRLSGFVKTKKVLGTAGMWLRIDEIRGDILSVGPEREFKGTKDWTACSAVFDVPQDAQDICFGPILQGAGRVWLSDLKFEVVDPKMYPQTPRADPEAKTPVHDEPTNLSFSRPWKELGSVPEWTPYSKGKLRAHMATGAEFHRKPVLELVGTKHQFDGIFQLFKAGPYLRKKLMVSAWLKTTDVLEEADMAVTVLNASHAVIARDDLDEEKTNRSIKGTRDWAKREMVLEVPSNADRISIGLGIEGSGTMEVCGVEIHVVDSSVPTTQNVAKPMTSEQRKYLDSLPSSPRNLQFNL